MLTVFTITFQTHFIGLEILTHNDFSINDLKIILYCNTCKYMKMRINTSFFFQAASKENLS